MNKNVKIGLWVCGGIISLPILIISILLVIHMGAAVFSPKDNLSYQEVVSKHPDANMIYYLGEPTLTLIKDCKVEYVAIENATAYIKIKGRKEYNTPLLNVKNDEESFMFLLENNETLIVSMDDPPRFTLLRKGKANRFLIEKVYTNSSY